MLSIVSASAAADPILVCGECICLPSTQEPFGGLEHLDPEAPLGPLLVDLPASGGCLPHWPEDIRPPEKV